MKRFFSIIFVFLVGTAAFAQTNDKISEVKFYQGDEYMPYIFDPYRADYGIDANLLGAELNLFKYRVEITELQDRWIETQYWQLPAFVKDKADLLSITTEIDLKTGLPIKGSAEFRGTTEEDGYVIAKSDISYADGKYTMNSIATDKNGKPKANEKFSLAVKEKYYPCQSMTFFSYLPLSDDFAASYTCLNADYDSFKQTDIHRVTKQTIRVFGSEKIVTKAGIFDCYKIKQSTEDLGYYDAKGVFHAEKKKSSKGNSDKLWGNFFGSAWIDKKTRKMVRAELMYKRLAGISIEMMPNRYKNF